ncbi:MAG: M3 family peptidase, partial [Alistipes sp.]|nr:M3 family peptidase [Alistipes sp.]
MKKTLFTLMSVSLLLAGCGEEAMPTVVLPEIDTTNPLLAEWDTPHQTPPFEQIKLEHYKPAFQTAIAVSRAEVDAIVNNPAKPTFANTILALEKQGALLNRIAGIFFNLNEADTSDELQAIAIELQPELTALSNDISLNPELFKRVKYVYEHPGLFLSKEDKQLLDKSYKDFVRSGANLSEQDKELYRQYTSELSSLTLKFGQNSLAATNAYS